jgi:hypothetical protein
VVAFRTKEGEEIGLMLAQKSARNKVWRSTSDEGETEGRGDDGHEKGLPHVWDGVGVDRGLEVGGTNNQREVPWRFIPLSKPTNPAGRWLQVLEGVVATNEIRANTTMQGRPLDENLIAT